MSFTQSFKLAIKSLMTSKMRALLTMLGISQVGKLITQGCIILAVVAVQQLLKRD